MHAFHLSIVSPATVSEDLAGVTFLALSICHAVEGEDGLASAFNVLVTAAGARLRSASSIHRFRAQLSA